MTALFLRAEALPTAAASWSSRAPARRRLRHGDASMPYAIPAPPVTTIPVVGGDPFPVRRVYCVGRNYAAHAREMGHDPDREPPFFFM
jgi:2-keto-4-pentenoate hydratase/2-oxohepta-3-ene-1,7-dioic acid hydratase in catechol pathway